LKAGKQCQQLVISGIHKGEKAMASFNRVILVGNLTRDVELRYTPSGTAVTDVSIAVNERIKKNDQWVDDVNYFDVTLWGRTAEIVNEYLGKGSPILIEGRLKQDSWEQEGQKRSKVKVIGERIQMLGGRPTAQGNSPHNGSRVSTAAAANIVAEDEADLTHSIPQDEVPF
jgi:single-strand DNA-binding protein